jgi:hypothetical protein
MNGSTSKIHSENPPNSLPKGAKSRLQHRCDNSSHILVMFVLSRPQPSAQFLLSKRVTRSVTSTIRQLLACVTRQMRTQTQSLWPKPGIVIVLKEIGQRGGDKQMSNTYTPSGQVQGIVSEGHASKKHPIPVLKPNPAYLTVTRKIDISNLPSGSMHDSITDGTFTVWFSTPLQKRGPVPSGWAT